MRRALPLIPATTVAAAALLCGVASAATTPAGQVTMFTQGIPQGSQPEDISAGPDGTIWFTNFGTATVARMTLQGNVTLFATPGSTDKAKGIAAGPDGNMWFSAYG